MTLKDYLRASAPDFVICLLLAGALGFVNCGAFYVSASLQYSIPLLAVVVAVPLLLLFFAAYNRATVFIGAAVLVVGTVIACAVSASVAGTESVFQDVEGNPAIFIVVVELGTVITFLMTRRRWLSRVFLVVAILDVCFVEFMYKQHYVPALVVALLAAGVMVIYRNYRSNLRDASTDKVSFLGATGIACAYAAVILGVACAIFLLVVAPLNPGALEFKPFTKYMTYERVDMTGVGENSLVNNPDIKTSNTNDNTEETNQENEEEEADSMRGIESQTLPDDSNNNGDELAEGDGQPLLQQLYMIVFEDPSHTVVFGLLLIAILVAPFVIKKLRRKRRFDRMCSLQPNQTVEELFAFCMKRFKILKIEKPANMTLAEFVETSKGQLAEFSQNDSGVAFAHIAALYSASVYGKVPLSDTEVEYCKAFYSSFYKAFVEKSGRLKYIFRFFRV